MIVLIARLEGILMPTAAADVAASVGRMNVPLLFFTDAYGNPFCRA